MIKEEVLKILDLAIRQDRERFFRLADPLIFQPKYKEHLDEIEKIKQQWRDLTKLPDYPNIDFPPSLPDWYPEWQFMTIIKDETLAKLIGDTDE